MKNKRESERLSKLFSGIEVLAVNPAGEPLEIQPELEIASPKIADPEESLSQHDIGEFRAEAELELPANPQEVEQQSPDIPIMIENDPIESADLNEKMGLIVESTLPLSDISNKIPPLSASQANTPGEMPMDRPSDRQSKADESNRADWGDVGIGMVTGIIVTGVILAGTSRMDIFNNPGRFILLGWEVLSGILGASASKSSKKTRREAWIGAIQWCLVPVWIALFIGLMIYFLTFTNFFGK